MGAQIQRDTGDDAGIGKVSENDSHRCAPSAAACRSQAVAAALCPGARGPVPDPPARGGLAWESSNGSTITGPAVQDRRRYACSGSARSTSRSLKSSQPSASAQTRWAPATARCARWVPGCGERGGLDHCRYADMADARGPGRYSQAIAGVADIQSRDGRFAEFALRPGRARVRPGRGGGQKKPASERGLFR